MALGPLRRVVTGAGVQLGLESIAIFPVNFLVVRYVQLFMRSSRLSLCVTAPLLLALAASLPTDSRLHQCVENN